MVENLSKEEAEEVLADNVFGHIGCNDGFNTYVFPTNYVYDNKFIYCHSLMGAKIRLMRENKRVCFQVDTIKNNLNWKSVMVLGDFSELEGEREKYFAIKKFNENQHHVKMNEGGKNVKLIIYRISLDEITGRYENTPL